MDNDTATVTDIHEVERLRALHPSTDLSTFRGRAIFVLGELAGHKAIRPRIMDHHIEFGISDPPADAHIMSEAFGWSSGERSTIEAARAIYRGNTEGLDLFALPADVLDRFTKAARVHRGLPI